MEFKCPPKLMQLCMKVLNIRGFKLIGDNVDFYKHVRDMRHDHQNKSIHWFHLYAVLDRVPSCHLDDTHSQQSLSSVPNCNFLLGSDELEKMRKCMGILVSRVLIENMSIFQGFSTLVTWHIEHKHSEEMKMKSIQVRVCK